MTPKHIMPAPADLPMVTSVFPLTLRKRDVSSTSAVHQQSSPAGSHGKQHRPHRDIDASRGQPEHRQQAEHVDQGGRV